MKYHNNEKNLDGKSGLILKKLSPLKYFLYSLFYILILLFIESNNYSQPSHLNKLPVKHTAQHKRIVIEPVNSKQQDLDTLSMGQYQEKYGYNSVTTGEYANNKFKTIVDPAFKQRQLEELADSHDAVDLVRDVTLGVAASAVDLIGNTAGILMNIESNPDKEVNLLGFLALPLLVGLWLCVSRRANDITETKWRYILKLIGLFLPFVLWLFPSFNKQAPIESDLSGNHILEEGQSRGIRVTKIPKHLINKFTSSIGALRSFKNKYHVAQLSKEAGLYLIAEKEFDSGKVDESLMSLAFVESGGDGNKKKAEYMKLRVQQLKCT
tara:strand:- start:1679 stop:2650 length:972 start_codon:yes stop_codon:yes gene_type:complete